MSTRHFTDHPSIFADRGDAGRRLAQRLTAYSDARPVVVGIAPGAVPVAAEIAHALGAPLETVAVAPLRFDAGADDSFGVAGEGGIVLFDPDRREQVDAKPELVDAALIKAEGDIERLSQLWHDGHRKSLHGRNVLLVSDVLADERLAAAAACAVRDRGAANVVLVVPRARLAAMLAVEDWVDEVVALELVDYDISSAECFDDSAPVSDAVVTSLLRENRDEQRRTQSQRKPHDV